MATDKIPILEKINSLVRLSTSPYEEEARSAALLAIKLMRQHGGRIVLSDGQSPPPPSPQRPNPPPPRPPPRSAGSSAREAGDKRRYEQARPQQRDQKVQPRWITAKYDSFCRECGIDILEGDRAFWYPGDGCVCVNHGPKR